MLCLYNTAQTGVIAAYDYTGCPKKKLGVFDFMLSPPHTSALVARTCYS
jgi:hypothetical protein